MSSIPFRYFILNKPAGMESQFVGPHAGALLGNLSYDFPEGTHAIGRLDKNSEGLLLLTTNKRITALLFQSKTPHKRTYLVQVRHKMNEQTLQRLQTGVSIRIKGGSYYTTPLCDVRITDPKEFFQTEEVLPYQLDNTWLLITLTEGKYHQVRKMVSAVHHRCMRLIRISIEDMMLGKLAPGEVKEVDEKDFFRLLKLETDSIKNTELKKPEKF